jgi:hypothetical protein
MSRDQRSLEDIEVHSLVLDHRTGHSQPKVDDDNLMRVAGLVCGATAIRCHGRGEHQIGSCQIAMDDISFVNLPNSCANQLGDMQQLRAIVCGQQGDRGDQGKEREGEGKLGMMDEPVFEIYSLTVRPEMN